MLRSNLENAIIIGIVVLAILLFIVTIMVIVFISGEEPSAGSAKALMVMLVIAYDVFAVFSLLTPLILAKILGRVESACGNPYHAFSGLVHPAAAPQAQTVPAANCPACGAAMSAANRFCPACGKQVKD